MSDTNQSSSTSRGGKSGRGGGRGGRGGRGRGGKGGKRKNTFGASSGRSKKRIKKPQPPPEDPDAEIIARRFVYDLAGRATEIPRCPKHKWALQFGYCGTGYKGLQIQDNVMTIERELANALFRCGALFDTNLNKINRIGWSRAARTDKGVHAASNLIVAKLMVSILSERERASRIWKATVVDISIPPYSFKPVSLS